MFDSFFKNLHYFKLDNNRLMFNNRTYIFKELQNEYFGKSILELYEGEDTKELLIAFMYEVYQDISIVWDKGQGYDGSKKYIDRIAYVEYFDERLNEYRRVTIKNFRFYNDEDDNNFVLRQQNNLYDLIYA